MADQRYEIRDGQGKSISVKLRRDKRLTKTSRWERMPDGTVLVRVPYRLPRHRISGLLEQVAGQLDKMTLTYSRRNDESLSERAKLVNEKYFRGELHWNAIRWVSNMNTRLGSCTQGGPTDGQIRISDKIKDWPDWVVDYVIAHELLHRKHPQHTKTFWNELKTAFPLAERAYGFILGTNFSGRTALQDDVDGGAEPSQADMPIDDVSDGT